MKGAARREERVVATGPPGLSGLGCLGEWQEAVTLADCRSRQRRWEATREEAASWRGMNSCPLGGGWLVSVDRGQGLLPTSGKTLKGERPTCLVYHGFPSGVQPALLPEAMHGYS
jgi:hypothetical protein